MRARMVLLGLLLPALLGCGGPKPRLDTLPTQEGHWIRASQQFERGDYIRAIETLATFVEAYPGSNRLDEALLLLGLARQKTGENLVAVEDFDRLIRDFPQSPHREQADYARARSYFDEALGPRKDPDATETALNLLRSYLLRYPSGAHGSEARAAVDECLERLALKAYFNAETYLSLRRYLAATIYLEKALRTKPEFERAGEAWARLARARERLGEREKARTAWQQFLEYATPDRVDDDPKLRKVREEAEEALRRLPPGTAEESAP